MIGDLYFFPNNKDFIGFLLKGEGDHSVFSYIATFDHTFEAEWKTLETKEATQKNVTLPETNQPRPWKLLAKGDFLHLSFEAQNAPFFRGQNGLVLGRVIKSTRMSQEVRIKG